jgi:hypothetical protein
MERREIHLLCINKLVACGFSQIFNVVNEKYIRLSVLRKKDNLGAARCEFVDDSGSNSRGASLTKLVTLV